MPHPLLSDPQIARVRGAEDGPTMQWHAHLDAIATEHPPARRDGDELIARGAVDIEGLLLFLESRRTSVR